MASLSHGIDGIRYTDTVAIIDVSPPSYDVVSVEADPGRPQHYKYCRSICPKP